MGRILEAYESKFRALLSQVRPQRLELGVRLLVERAERLAEQQKISLPLALARVYDRARQQIERRQETSRSCGCSPLCDSPSRVEDNPVFVCDAGLGGLARWLRAAGYEAHWRADIDDDELIREARRIPATLLTTDSLLMQRGVLRDGFIPALWVPPTLKKFDQLALVLCELRMPVCAPRCMSCGGTLRRVHKEEVRERIPPKTYRWLDDYFLCTGCDKLFWHGTHWDRIGQRLQSLSVAHSSAPN